MTIADAPKLLTTEDLLAMPDDGIERYLIDGLLRGGGMTVRNSSHSEVLMKVGFVLMLWVRDAAVKGRVVGGEAGFRLARDPDTTVGIDVAFVSEAVFSAHRSGRTIIQGPPILAVEITSPSDAEEDVEEKLEKYLACGVALVWVLHPQTRVLTLHRPDRPVEAYDVSRRLENLPELPGFSCAVADLF